MLTSRCSIVVMKLHRRLVKFTSVVDATAIAAPCHRSPSIKLGRGHASSDLGCTQPVTFHRCIVKCVSCQLCVGTTMLDAHIHQ